MTIRTIGDLRPALNSGTFVARCIAAGLSPDDAATAERIRVSMRAHRALADGDYHPSELIGLLYERDERACVYCGDVGGPFEKDHILALSRGGSDHPSNLALACRACNRSKKDRPVAEWLSCR